MSGRNTNMNTAADYPPLQIGPRTVPMPARVSDAARAYLAMPRAVSLNNNYPALDDKEGWRAHIAAVNAMIGQMEQMIVGACAIEVERTTINGARAAIVRPK